MDRLSELPLSLIHCILSFLPIRDAVKTTILSKCWEDVWTTVPCLNLISIVNYDMEDSIRAETQKFKNTVNWALILWKGVKILKFKIHVYSRRDLLFVSDVNVWTRFAVNNKVEELEIISYEVGQPRTPRCLNSCSSLRKLSLLGVDVQNLKSPSWNQLKSLSIDMLYPSRISGDLINQILLGSPELEVFELKLDINHENLNITSRSLKNLKIHNYVYDSNAEQSLDTFSICCPNLKTLEISGLFGKCVFTDVSSLYAATLRFDNFGRPACLFYESLGGILKQVLSTTLHVEEVALSDLCVQVIGASQNKYLLPSLPNVKFLKLRLRHIEFSNIMDVLRIFPNLKMLVIEQERNYEESESNIMNYMEFETNLFKSFLLQLKIVEISLFDFSVFGIIEFLLKHAIMLEKFVLRFRGITRWHQKTCLEKVLSMPRSSPTVEVILKNK